MWRRFWYLRSTIANWPLAVPDKLGLVRSCRYRTRSGLAVSCRGRSTDVNEAVVVLSGLEYPAPLVRLDAGSVVVDLGANIGSFALYVADVNRGVGFRGTAFEPLASSFDLLEQNLSANGIASFDAVQAAVTGTDGWVNLQTDCQPDRVRVAGTAAEGDPSATRSHRLSTYCAARGIEAIDLLKIDVEGAEYDIFAADYPFIRAAVGTVLIEYHDLGGDRTPDRLLAAIGDDFEVTPVHTGLGSGVLHARNRAGRGAARRPRSFTT
jgi:FkbM family methyltransferase